MTQTRSRQILILIVAFIGVGILLDVTGYLQPLQGSVQMLLVPAQRALTFTGQEISRQTETAQTMEEMQARIQELESLNNQLMVENIQLQEVERENEQLRQLLNYTRSNPQFSYQPATVVVSSIGLDPSNLLYYVYVDTGARDGIAKDMPAITDRGLVGRVTAVGPNWAQILMLIDPGSAVNALVQNSRITGVVRGNVDGTLTMDRIPQNRLVSPGDIVLTSGLGGNYPDKLVIGQITEVSRRDQDMFQVAQIRPTVDFDKLETLLIITSFEPIDFEEELLDNQEATN